MRLGLGLGIPRPAGRRGGADPIALGAATWEGGLYLDVPLLGLGGGAVLSSTIAPQVGAQLVTPVNSPVVDGVGIGGRDAARINDTNQLFTAHWLSTIANGTDLPLTVIMRLKRDFPASTRYAWGFQSSGSATDNFIRGPLPLGASNSPQFQKDAAAETTKTITRTGALGYADHVIAWVTDGNTGLIYLDGVEVASGDLNTLAITVNRFAFGATVSTATQGPLGGWVSKIAVTPQALSPAQVAEVTAHWLANDLGTPGKSDGAKFGWFGDSITKGDTDAYSTSTRGGFRYDAYELWRAQRLRIRSVGPNVQGIFANPENSATGGFAIASITSQISTDIPIYQPRGAFVMAGTNDADSIEAGSMTLGQFRALYDTMLSTLRTALDQYQSDGQIIVANLIPIQGGTLGSAAIGDMNSEIAAAVAAHDAANPTKPPIIECDFHAAIGGAYDAGNYSDTTHPNATGYRLLGAELTSKAGAYFASIG